MGLLKVFSKGFNRLADMFDVFDVESEFQGEKFTTQDPKSCKIIYGQHKKITGNVVAQFTKTQPNTDSDDIQNKTLYTLIQWTYGSIESIDQVYFNKEPINSEEFKKGGTSYIFSQHFIDGGDHDIFDDGTPTPTKITSTKGHACTLITQIADPDVMPARGNITADIRGKKILNISNDLIEYSNNHADIIWDYFTSTEYGYGLPESRLNKSQFLNERAFLAEIIERFPGQPNPNPRASCSVILDTADKLSDNLKKLRSSILASLPYDLSSGAFNFVIDRSKVASIYTIDDSNTFGHVEITSPSKSDIPTGVKVTFTNIDLDGKSDSATYPVGANSSKTVKGHTIGTAYEALELAEVLYNQAQFGQTVETTVDIAQFGAKVGEIVTLDFPLFGIDNKPYALLSREDDTIKETADVTLIEYQPSVYAFSPKNEIIYPPSNYTPKTKAEVPTNFSITYYEDKSYQAVIAWDSPHVNFDLFVDGNFIARTGNKSYQISGYLAGSYVLEVQAIDGVGSKSDKVSYLFTISLDSSTPEFDVSNETISIRFPKPKKPRTRWALTDDFNASVEGGTNGIITGLAPDTPYYIWVQIINDAGASEWVKHLITTTGDPTNLTYLLDGELNIGNLSQAAQDEIDAIKSDILNNAGSIVATNNALQVTDNVARTNIAAAETALLAAAHGIDQAIINNNNVDAVTARIDILDVTVLEKADSFTVNALQADLQGQINQLSTGDISAQLEVAIGDITGRVDAVELFIEPTNFALEVNTLIFAQDYATNTFVTQQLSAIGIENYVSQTTYTSDITTITSNIENLGVDSYNHTLASYSILSDADDSIYEKELALQAQLVLQALDGANFKGALASFEQQIDVLTTDTNAKVLNLEILAATVGDDLGSAVLRIDQAEADINGNANSIASVEALANSAAGTASSALTLASSANSSLESEFFLNATYNAADDATRVAGVKGGVNGDISKLQLIAQSTELGYVNDAGAFVPSLTFDTVNKALVIPEGSLTLTQGQKDELKGENGAGIYGYDSTNAGYGVLGDPVTAWPTNAGANERFKKVSGGRDPVDGDHLNIYNQNATPNPFAEVRRYDNGAWVAPTLVIDGDLLVDGAITAEKLNVDAISGKRGKFGTGEYILRLNESTDFPIWYGKETDTITRDNALWYVDSFGRHKRDFTGGVYYLNRTFNDITPNPYTILTNTNVVAEIDHGESAVELSSTLGIQLNGNGFYSGRIGITVEWYRKEVFQNGSLGEYVHIGSGISRSESYSGSQLLTIATGQFFSSVVDIPPKNYTNYVYYASVTINDSGSLLTQAQFRAIQGTLNVSEITETKPKRIIVGN